MQIQLERKTPAKMLNPASGYLSGYTHTLNPFAGCAFACSYCDVLANACIPFSGPAMGRMGRLEATCCRIAAKELLRYIQKGPVTIFMSSSTDPYQPAEYRARITLSLLEVMTLSEAGLRPGATRSPTGHQRHRFAYKSGPPGSSQYDDSN